MMAPGPPATDRRDDPRWIEAHRLACLVDHGFVDDHETGARRRA
jgi:hypothetical protein